MKVVCYTYLLFFLVFGCAHDGSNEKGLKRRNISEYFVGSGIIRYFLPELPEWINFSTTASCHRKRTIKYIDFEKLRNSFAMNYSQVVQLQYMFNNEYEGSLRDVNSNYILFQDEENLFHDISDKVQAGLDLAFRIPKYNRIHFVWVDFILSPADKIKKIQELMKSELMLKGHPVFISLCMNHFEFVEFLEKNDIHDQNIRIIPAEMFSIFDKDNQRWPIFSLDFTTFFGEEKELHMFISGQKMPKEFVGKFIIHNY